MNSSRWLDLLQRDRPPLLPTERPGCVLVSDTFVAAHGGESQNRPILFLGQPGCGKIHLAVALATLAVEAGYRGHFTTADNLCRTLVRASIEGNLASKVKAFNAPTVLVVDDVGLLPIGGTEAPPCSSRSSTPTARRPPHWS